MKRLLAALALLILAGCAGSGQYIKPIDLSKASPIYISPIENDYYDIPQRLSLIVARAGFDPVKNDNARYRLDASYNRSALKVEVVVKIFDQVTGDKIYQGEGVNNGWGTMLSRQAAIVGAFEAALSNLQR